MHQGPKEVVRANQGRDPNIELNWGDTGLPAPLECERWLDTSYIPDYITEWINGIPDWPKTGVFDLSAASFLFGTAVMNNDGRLMDHPEQPHTIPDLEHSDNVTKQLTQTSELEACSATRKKERHRGRAYKARQSEWERQLDLLNAPPEPHPFAPAIDIYLKPADEGDIAGITRIYNYYVTNSTVPEDQIPVEESDIRLLLQSCKEDKYPIIVAIKGSPPSFDKKPKFSSRQTAQQAITTELAVIGFAFSEPYNCGITGARTGRSRYTARLNLFTHHQFTRKGVGRSLMDRLLQIMSAGYAARDGYSWINPENSPTYMTGGVGRCHQMIIELPCSKDDPNYAWVKAFLQKFYFKEEAKLISVARSSIHRAMATWLDIALFQCEAMHGDEFDPYL
ncbi:hypothetical protein F5884DRAFT_664021 [Xylogone sp. PMI_703]|nr:hypothetical protein F5884DRAFT_664021 [Xylogone sp. PMI_703]